MKRFTIFALCLILLNCSVFQKYYQEAYNIAAAMTIDQKIGQTIQADLYAITTPKAGTDAALAAKYHLGSVLVGGNGCPDQNGNLIQMPSANEQKQKQIYAGATLQKWQKLAAKLDYTISVTTNGGKTYGIKPLLGTDAVHNNQHVVGTILFPHNIGLSCTHNPQNFYNVGYWTSKNVKTSGFNYAFAPTVAVSHNPQWGRYFQTMGQQHDKIYQYAKSFTQGLQGKPDSWTGVLGSAKHFFGDGATMYGADQGNAHVGSFKSFLDHNLQGYYASVEAGIGSVMASYSAINWVPLSVGPSIGHLLKGKMGFDGFVISDYDQVTKIASQQLPTSYQQMQFNESFATLLTAGIDMFMLPGWYGIKGITNYIEAFKEEIKNNSITTQRINDAVAKILSVKMALGLVQILKEEQNNIRFETISQPIQRVHGTSEYQDSLTAVQESLVLLKNANVIPVKTSTLEYIVLVGERIININGLTKNQLFRSFDNIGMQSGGWTVRWNGFQGNSMWQGDSKTKSNATSILDALKNLNQQFQMVYPDYKSVTEVTKIDIQRTQYLEKLKTLRKKMTAKNTLILSVVGESPYAEFCGDVNIPYCQNQIIGEGDGCLYDGQNNPYMPPVQRTSLALDFDKFDTEVINHIREEDKNIPMLTILLAGRPMIIDNVLAQSSAVISAFLPGTSGGEGIVNAITGKYVIRPNGQSDIKNSLSFDWPKSMDQLKNYPYYGADGQIPKIADPLFKVGYGLSSFTGSQQIQQ